MEGLYGQISGRCAAIIVWGIVAICVWDTEVDQCKSYAKDLVANNYILCTPRGMEGVYGQISEQCAAIIVWNANTEGHGHKLYVDDIIGQEMSHPSN